jgi:FkbM family methyltransferase
MSFRIYWFRDMPWLFDSVPREPAMNEVVEKLCETFRPRVFWDVGANLGWYSWLVNSRTNLDQAVALEPLPENCRLLKDTISRNQLRDIEVVQTAVADRVGKVSFRVDTKSGATSQLSELYATSNQTAIAHTYNLETEMQVDCTTLDELVRQGQPVPDLIKLDVEEAEHLVFQGASQLLEQGRTIIVFECHRLEAIEILRRHRYLVFAIDALHNFIGIPAPLAQQASAITSALQLVN